MDPLIVIGLLVLGGVLTAGLLWVLDRVQRPARQRAETAWQLAVAQQRHERRRIASGPMFARAAQHIQRITERAAAALYHMEAGRYDDAQVELRSLLRHCQELADHMKPKQRRDDPEAWRL